ncbi:hypothetical protein [uncultured Dialister sp.]|uniref:hypothetical protein n=1 Tax=uncultured Dialister sp. TaxID=278064 RepID=UPI0025FCCDC1|nr:hypothetical protein [uncultured Dialister sp.]
MESGRAGNVLSFLLHQPAEKIKNFLKSLKAMQRQSLKRLMTRPAFGFQEVFCVVISVLVCWCTSGLVDWLPVILLLAFRMTDGDGKVIP